jgi:DNA-directed RNA polymerase sigma subunit (sigma70/sigma32)
MADPSDTAEQTMTEREEWESIGRRLERLDGTERSIVILRYGLAGEPPMTFDQIADRLGLVAAAIPRSVAAAMRKLSAHPLTHVAVRPMAYETRVG